MKVTAVIQARMGSTRLPGKVLRSLCGQPVLWHIVRRMKKVRGLNDIVVATSTSIQDQAIIEFCNNNDIKWFAGSENDVLDRFVQAARSFDSDQVVRITADCPLIGPELVEQLIKLHIETDADITTHNQSGLVPRGVSAAVVKANTLKDISQKELENYHREHVTIYIYEHPERYKIVHAPVPESYRRSNYRLTLDTEEDWRLVEAIYDKFYEPTKIIDLPEVITLLDNDAQLLAINSHIQQKEVRM